MKNSTFSAICVCSKCGQTYQLKYNIVCPHCNYIEPHRTTLS
jgi:DNA-directed RNA polymerase subunit RPC12/RpoP